MFNINKSDLAYERIMRLMEAEEQEAAPNPNDPMDLNNNIGAPSNDSINASKSGVDPQQAYEMALRAMDEKIEQTGRKRYQKYRMDGGKDSFNKFKDDMEQKALEQIDKEMKQEFGFVPGKEDEKDLLIQIRDLLRDLKQNNDEEQQLTAMHLTGQLGNNNQDQNMDQQQEQNIVQQPVNDQQQDQNQNNDQQNNQDNNNDNDNDNNEQQAQQEALDILNEMMYRRKMKSLFNHYLR